MDFKFLCFILFWSDYCKKGEEDKQFITLIAPSAIYSTGIKKSYSALILTSKIASNTEILLSLKDKQKFFSNYGEIESSQLITFENIKRRHKKDPLRIVARRNEKCISREIFLARVHTNCHVLIQLDKPSYHPDDEIKFFIIAFDDDTKPIGINSIKIEMRDGDGMEVKVDENLSEQNFRKFELFKSSYKIKDKDLFGEWKIKATINGRWTSEKNFKVDKSQRSIFEVFIESKEFFYYDDETFTLKLYAKYNFGEFIDGIPEIKIYDKTGRLVYEKMFKESEKVKKVEINIKSDLKIYSMKESSTTFDVVVEFFNKELNLRQKKTKQIKIIRQKENFIEVIRHQKFEADSDFRFIVAIRDHEGKVIQKSNESVEMKCTKIGENSTEVVHQFHDQIENGFVQFVIKSESDVKELRIEVKFLDAKTELIVKPELEFARAMRVVAAGPLIRLKDDMDYKPLNITVESSLGLSKLIALIIGRHGIIYTKYFECHGRKRCLLEFQELEENFEVKPRAKIVVYNFENEFKKISYGSNLIDFGELGNEVNITLPSKTFPGEEIEVKISSDPNSIVSILASNREIYSSHVDFNQLKQEVMDELTKERKIRRANNSDNEIIFDEENGNFILNIPLDGWQLCTAEENEFFDSNSAIEKRQVDDEILSPEIDSLPKNETSVQLENLRKNFPETWTHDAFYALHNGTKEVNLKVPDSITSWILSAFSINNQGLAIAKPQEIVTIKEFFIELKLPYSIKFGEILTVEVIAFNLIEDEQMLVDMTIIAQNQFEFIEYIDKYQSCRTQPTKEKNQTLNFIIDQRRVIKKFLVKPLINKEVKIRVEAKAESLNDPEKIWFDAVEKEVKVEIEGAANFDTQRFEFKLNNSEKPMSYSLERPKFKTVQAIKLSVDISGDIVGPALDVYKGIFEFQSKNDNISMAKLSYMLWLLIYFQKIENLSTEGEKYAKKLFEEGYKHLRTHQQIDGGISVHKNSSSSTFLTAYTAYIFAAINKFEIDQNSTESAFNFDVNYSEILQRALEFCIANQAKDGSFNQIDFDKFPFPSKDPLSRSISLTAFVLVALIKNQNFTDDSAIEKGFKFIEIQTSYDNFAAALCACAAALAGRNSSHFILETLSQKSYADGDMKFWDLDNKNWTSLNTKILVSSYVAMAYIQLNQVDKAQPIIRWLLRQRDSRGEFPDSYSTAIGIEALVKMGFRTASGHETKIHFDFYDNSSGKKLKSYDLSDKNALKSEGIELPENILNLRIKAKGSGYGLVVAHFEYFVIYEKVSKVFALDVFTAKEAKDVVMVQACFRRTLEKEHNEHAILEFNLVFGLNYMANETNPKGQNENITEVELLRARTSIHLHLDHVAWKESCIKIYAKKDYEPTGSKEGSVKIYEFEHKDETFTSAYYDLGNVGC